MNPFDELQQMQQPQQPLGAMLATPQAGPPAQQQVAGMGPPASPEDYARRTQGWSGALNELLASPELAVMLMQAGMALSSGRGAMDSFGEGMGAVGRFGAMQGKQRQQDLINKVAGERLGFERQDAQQQAELHPLAMQYKQMQLQQMQEQMARAGRGGVGGGASQPEFSIDQARATGLFSEEELREMQRASVAKKMGMTVSKPAKAEAGLSPKDALNWAMDIEAQFGDMDPKKLTPEQLEMLNAARAVRRQLLPQSQVAPPPAGGDTKAPKTAEEQATSSMWSRLDSLFQGGKGKPQSKPQAKDAGAAVAGKMALTPGNVTNWFGTGDRPDVGPPAPNSLDMTQRRIDEFLQIMKDNSIFRNW